jgi:hypothetical protein
MSLRLDPNRNIVPAADPLQVAVALVVRGITTDSASRQVPGKIARLARIQRLVEDKAWTEAALALIELELPQWQLRRLTCESGEWFCSLTQHPELPVELDDAAEAHHPSLPMAIMQAVLEAWGRSSAERGKRALTVPDVQPAKRHLVCCDNFA